MKIYCCSDIHNQFHKFNPPRDVDLILCAGDMTNFGIKDFGEEYQNLKAWLDLHSQDTEILYIPGNHDLFLKNNQIDGHIRHNNTLHALSKFQEVSMYGASMSTAYDYNDLAVIWENMTANPKVEEAYYSSIPYCDILLSHSPPSGSLGTEDRWGDLGSKFLRKWIEKNQPKLVVCGHIHDPKEREEYIGKTRVINVATIERVIEIEV